MLKLSKQRGECSKLIFPNTSVLLLLLLLQIALHWYFMVLSSNHFQEASNEFRKQVMVRMHPIIPLIEKQVNSFDLNHN